MPWEKKDKSVNINPKSALTEDAVSSVG